MRHRLALSAVDLFLIALATLAAELLRDNLETRPEQFRALLPYMALTLAAAIPAEFALGLNRSIWRLSGMRDYVRVVAAAALIVGVAVALGFLLNRLEGIARSLPIIQGFLIASALVGMRVLFRLRHAGRQRRSTAKSTAPAPSADVENVLVVGVNRISELYVLSLAEFAHGSIVVAGVLGVKERHTGGLLHQHKILGMPEDVASILRDLEVHGVFVDRIVTTIPFTELSSSAREALLEIETSSNIKLEFFADALGMTGQTPNRARATSVGSARSEGDGYPRIGIDKPDLLARQAYWRTRRALDVVGGVCATIVLAPMMLLVAIMVAIDVGLPIIFWQQRPGAGGRPFKLFKFRTMAAAYDRQGRRVAEDQRHSLFGRCLRALRLDELPQLYNIVIGEMSFIGPRPLLEIDQFPALSARLAVRPGLTGWAQTKGGRLLTPSDKAALDVWYVRNADIRIDLEILLETARMVVRGERTDRNAIRQAWRELGCDRVGSEVPQTAMIIDFGNPPTPKTITGGHEGISSAEQPRGSRLASLRANIPTR